MWAPYKGIVIGQSVLFRAAGHLDNEEVSHCKLKISGERAEKKQKRVREQLASRREAASRTSLLLRRGQSAVLGSEPKGSPLNTWSMAEGFGFCLLFIWLLLKDYAVFGRAGWEATQDATSICRNQQVRQAAYRPALILVFECTIQSLRLAAELA